MSLARLVSAFDRSVPLSLPGQVDFGPLIAEYEPLFRTVGGFLGGMFVVYLVGRLLFIPTALELVRRRNRNNPTIETATETYAHLFVVALALVVGVAVAGFGGLLTNSAVVVAALTLVVGVAGQEVIGSLVSGLFLVADPDFNVGDWIAWPGGEGVVESVDFRVTRVRTVDNETVTVPNTELTGNAITRLYGRDRYRITERVDIAYGDDAELALKELRTVAHADDRVLDDPEASARIVELGESSVALRAEFWVEDPMDVSLVDVRSDFRRQVKSRFDEVGLTLGPPSGREVSGEVSVSVDGEGGGVVDGSAGD